MKKFVLAFGIPVLAVASLIGSGYATWYFNSDVDRADRQIGLELTEKAVGAKFQHPEENIKLVLDQSPSDTDGMPAGRQGVHFEGAFTESLVADDGEATTTDDKFVDGTSYIVTTTVTISPAVAEYVNFTFNGHTSSATNLKLTKTQEFKYADLADSATKNTFKVFDITDVTVAYAEGKEPSTLAAYNTMLDAVKDQTIDFSFAAVVAVK
mgnify:CR=1 FL=1